jgi:rhodanese-related sulfurtransferase
VEFREIHAEGARLLPLDRLDPNAVVAGRNGTAGELLYVICRSGSRAKQVCERFLAAGHHNVVCVEGGTLAWEQAGLPVKRGKKAISLERQVRIAAGLLVLLGAVLGFLVHPYFIALSAFVGAGLVFTGVTDTCGMGLLLARMPWNQVNEEPGKEKAGQGPHVPRAERHLRAAGRLCARPDRGRRLDLRCSAPGLRS